MARSFIINHYPDDKYPWYVQEINYLDWGRFTTEDAAKEHLRFLIEESKE